MSRVTTHSPDTNLQVQLVAVQSTVDRLQQELAESREREEAAQDQLAIVRRTNIHLEEVLRASRTRERSPLLTTEHTPHTLIA